MTDLAAWLLERVSADEAAARALLRRSQDVQLQLADPKVLGLYIPGWHDWPDVEAMCARVLAECDARRQLVAEHAPWTGRQHGDAVYCSTCVGYPIRSRDHIGVVWPCPTLRLLALPYSDAPGYDEAWRP